MSRIFFGRVAAITLAMAFVPTIQAADARPNSDEECVMECDKQSDQCMEKAGNDEEKAKACDDRYSECLKKCR
jgi:hypothetical protein